MKYSVKPFPFESAVFGNFAVVDKDENIVKGGFFTEFEAEQAIKAMEKLEAQDNER